MAEDAERFFVPRCHWCGKFMKLADARHHFEPDAEMHPEESWWEHAGDCPTRSPAVEMST